MSETGTRRHRIPSENPPTRPILKRALSLTHTRFIPLDAHGHIGKHAHPAFGALDGLYLALDGDLGGRQLLGGETGGFEEAESEAAELEGCAFC